MKKVISLVLGLALSIAVCFSMTACSKYNTLEDIKAKGVITMATNAEFAPFESIEGDEYVGIDIDIAKEIAKALGVELKINNMAFDAVITSVQKGQSDFVMAGLTVNEKRKKSIDFTTNYFGAAQYLIVAKSNTTFDACTSADEVIAAMKATSAKAGAQRGTTGFFWLKGNTAFEFTGFSNITTTGYTSGALAAQAVINGQENMVVIDELPAKAIVAENSNDLKLINFSLTEENYAAGVHKGNDELREAINQILADLEESGRLQEIFDAHTQDAE